jgi:hypothetical protein
MNKNNLFIVRSLFVTIALSILKLMGFIGWSWWLVLLPTWGTVALLVLAYIILMVTLKASSREVRE